MVKSFELNAEFPSCYVTATFNECATIIVNPHIAWNSHVLFSLCCCKSL
ncbi:Type VI secretion system effector, Hcp1 family [Yersinia intermedia ATCC 29909]|nr:Type VI secretion system effector, Hcp1 family [Yersinia intermedia ATCC 29909]